MHVPVEVAERARAEALRLGVDGLVAVGGGSAIGLAKAVALTSGRPIVAVPTTYAGSEMTSIWGLTDGAVKRTGRDRRVLPASVVYDPGLTLGLPVGVSVTSGFNALAHAVEAMYAPDRTPVITLYAVEGVRSLVSALPQIASAATDLSARTTALYGAWLCGACLGATTMSLHHRLCHALGGTLDLPHAETHTVVLPHVLAFNQPAVPGVVARLASALGADDPAIALWDLAGALGAPRSLADLGLAERDLDRVAEQVTAAPYANPRPAGRADVTALLHDAWSGVRPRSATGPAR
jgi:maleylacetate reductase